MYTHFKIFCSLLFLCPFTNGFAQAIICNDYNIPCTNPLALDENYGFHQASVSLNNPNPIQLTQGLNELPFEMPCGIIQDINMSLHLEHDNTSNLEVSLSVKNNNPDLNNLPSQLIFKLIHISSCPDDISLDIDVLFDDDAAIMFDTACFNQNGIVTGTFDPFSNLSVLNTWAVDQFEDWTLQIQNDGNSTGTLFESEFFFTFGFPAPYQIDSTLVASVDLINEQVVETDCDQNIGFGSLIDRTWRATLNNGETEICMQTVGLLAPQMEAFILPSEVIINCDNVFDYDSDYSTYLSYGCHPLSQDHHGLCDVSYTYNDEITQTDSSLIINRAWLIVNWCTGENENFDQVINVQCFPFTISGVLESSNGYPPTDATVYLEGANAQEQTTSGFYQFEVAPDSSAYTIRPEKNNHPLNGVSTYDLVLLNNHILDIQPLDDPYKIIAADVNQDGIVSTFDIILLRQLILFLIQELPNGKSWRFIPTDFVFPNPLNPFETPFPETITIDSLIEPMDDLDFISIKIGDLNG